MFSIIIVVLSFIAFRAAIKIILGTFSSPSFLSESDSFKFSHKFYSKSENVCELPDKQKDFIQLN